MNIKLAFAEVEGASAEDVAAIVTSITNRNGLPRPTLLPPPAVVELEPDPVVPEKLPAPDDAPRRGRPAKNKPERVLLVAEPRIPGRRNLRRTAAEPKTKKAPADPPKSEAPPHDGSTPEMCLALVKKGPPMTSRQIFESLQANNGFRGAIGAVYAALAYHKNKGILESRDVDGERKWFPV